MEVVWMEEQKSSSQVLQQQECFSNAESNAKKMTELKQYKRIEIFTSNSKVDFQN